MKRFTLLTCVFAALGVTVPGSAEPANPAATAPPVDELVAQALERAPSLAALKARLAAAREMVAPAGALPDPMVELMWLDMRFPKYTIGTDEGSMIGPEFRQELPYPGKREARRKVAAAEAEIRSAELELARRQIAMQVRTSVSRLYAIDRERQALAAARDLLDLLTATATARYSVGEADQEAAIKAQLEVSRLAEQQDDLAAERTVRLAALNRLLDRTGDAPLGLVLELPVIETPSGRWEDLVLAASSEVAVRQKTLEAAARRVETARLDLRPNFTAGGALGLRGRFDPAVTLRFGVEIPLWRKQKQEPLIRAATQELDMARAELRDAQAAARAEAARLAAEWRRAENQIQRYEQAIVPQTSAAIDAARASYLAGRGDFLTVVDDFNRWLSARVQLAQRKAERFRVWAELQALLAPLPTPSEKEN